jgi:diguanylate cyclase (GGDEF)-like protein/PAS domain S-box-containing protein
LIRQTSSMMPCHPVSGNDPVRPEVEQRFRTLVESIPGVAAYMDVVSVDDAGDATPVYIGPQIEVMLGYPRDAWLADGELWRQVIHPDDAERIIKSDADARANLGMLFAEYRMIARDGRTVWISEQASVVHDAISGTTYWLGVMVDITDRKTTQEALAGSERQFRSIFDAAVIGVMTVALDGHILEANPTLEQVCDARPGALNGQPLTTYLDATDQTSMDLFRELASGHRDRFQIEHRWRSDRALMWCRTVMALVRDSDGHPSRITAMVEDITDRKRDEADLVHRTMHDGLTGLPNRHLFVDRFQQAQARRRTAGAGVAVLFIDIDGFKDINDSLGHHAGDELLVEVGRRLTAAVRPADTVARYAGDEFLVLTDQVDSVIHATQLAWRLTHSLRTPYLVGDTEITLSASIGVCFSTDQADQPDDLLQNADRAMYAAKRQGRNRVEVFGHKSTGEVAA